MKYNTLCDKLQVHICSDSGPRQGMVPKKIPYEGFFSLDVNDEIWQDVGLEDGEETGSVSSWLGMMKSVRTLTMCLSWINI
jgi:hypothetical protein